MKKPFFRGEQLVTIDAKRRVTIGSDFRRQLEPLMEGGAFVVTLGEGVPWFYPEKYYEDLMNAQVPLEVQPDHDLSQYLKLKFNLAVTVKLDPQWRLTLPESVIADAKLGNELALVGDRDHLTLYNQSDWAPLRAYLVKNCAVIEARATAKFEARKKEQIQP